MPIDALPGEIEVPHVDVDGVYWSFRDGRLHLSDDPRTLRHPDDPTDPRALLSVLQFGAGIPPLTPWQGVRRLQPGYRYELRPDAPPRRLNALPFAHGNASAPTLDARADVVEGVLDRALAPYEPDVCLFSGGTDSGLLAARMAARGQPVALAHFSFGSDDTESVLAAAMARQLRLPFERIEADGDDQLSCLEEPGLDYPLPFGDMSVAPTAALARAVVARWPGERVVLDGTGADGSFGMARKIRRWRTLARVPLILRGAAGELHRAFAFRSGAAERWLRHTRLSSTMPLLSGAVAHNALAGILYERAGTEELHELLADWLAQWPLTGFAQRVVAADVALVCANAFAQKAHAIYRRAQHRVLYPFMMPEPFALGLSATDGWPSDEAKAPLKRALARVVPDSMVYRPKSPFIDPYGRLFRDSRFLDALLDAISSTSPLRALTHPAAISDAIDRLRTGATLPFHTLGCLWSIAFLDRWLRTADRFAGAGVTAVSRPGH